MPELTATPEIGKFEIARVPELAALVDLQQVETCITDDTVFVWANAC